MPTRRAAAGLLIALTLPTLGEQRVWFEDEVAEAAKAAKLHSRPTVVVSASDDCVAWVFPPVPIIYVDEPWLKGATREGLCVIAYHEVCHLRLAQLGIYDDDAHDAVDKCMREIGAWRCLYLREYL